MPKIVDYAVRFAFLREAAFEVVLRDGPGGVAALSRRSVAAALGTSVNTVRRLLAADADLIVLAADEVERRRRHGRLGRLRAPEPADSAVLLLRTCLPDTAARVAEELVWLRLHLAVAAAPEDRDRDGLLLRERFRIHEGHDVYEGRVNTVGDGPALDSRASVPHPLDHHLSEREAAVSARVEEALDLLGCADPDRAERGQELRTLLAGLTLEVCLGATSPDGAVAALARTVRRWCPVRVAE